MTCLFHFLWNVLDKYYWLTYLIKNVNEYKLIFHVTNFEPKYVKPYVCYIFDILY